MKIKVSYYFFKAIELFLFPLRRLRKNILTLPSLERPIHVVAERELITQNFEEEEEEELRTFKLTT